ncbi:MAG TPA: roadblock/LC7 domain-containing protein [Candidatus Sabulitectum sp.]|nr:roadblock/LC7 domain-containing protein [Candidatus Sabulitectum sp.]HPJ27930.1 roadblock/LC7 domain-containing protein [Candidatus Sabulitectum sp.]HPR21733.1 roadblock/LC7 domain-containing protein [Candidatus Sabulitectum sp.]HRW77805.1 roadblock/LC7 domain-containing protein [Candidatus Sabulitectum sp.]
MNDTDMAKAERNGEVNGILDGLVEKTEAITALVISRQGICLGQAGTAASLNSTALAALVAGMFSATKEVANIVGEDQFSILLQQGEKRHIHISLIGSSSMMVIVFEDYSRIGKVRLAARQAAGGLLDALEQGRRRKDEAVESLSVPDFKEYAMNLIDRIFVVGEDEDAPS